MNWIASTVKQESFHEIKNTSLGKLVRDYLLNQIMSGTLRPGQALREPELVEQMKVSRVPVREALRELESMGLVVSRKHSGAYIRELSEDEVRDLYQFRALMDNHAGQMVASMPQERRAELVARLEPCIAAMDLAIDHDDVKAYYDANLQFHWLFIEMAGNREIEKSYREVIQKLHLARVKNLSTKDHRQRSNAEHKQIVRALRDADSIASAHHCAELLSHHVVNAHSRLAEM
jgi:DNA-binding GntR family transcriptional regulator